MRKGEGLRVTARGGGYNSSSILASDHYIFKIDYNSDINRCTHFPWIGLYTPLCPQKPNYIYLINAHTERFSCQKKNGSNCKDLTGIRADVGIATIPVWP